MEAKVKDIPEESKFMKELWEIRKKYYFPEDQDSYWQELVKDVEIIHEKYKGNLFVEKCLLGLVADLEARWKEKRKNEN